MITQKFNELIKRGKLSQIQSLVSNLEEQLFNKLEDSRELLNDQLGLDFDHVLKVTRPELDMAKSKCREPLKVALVGEYSTGKTTTLMSLFKSPGIRMLPRNMVNASTGNVTEIRMYFGEPEDNNGVFSNCTISLFDSPALEAMMRYYYNKLRSNEIIKRMLPELDENLLGHLNSIRQSVRHLLQDVDEKKYENNIPTQTNQDLADFYRLILSLESFKSKFGAFPGSSGVSMFRLNTLQERFPVLLGNVLQLDIEERRGGVLKIEERMERYWKSIPESLEILQRQCEAGSAPIEAMRGLFLLVSRVTLHVRSDQDMDSGDIKCISFLDFPGLGSANSRDKWLCKHEMKSANVNLFFLNGEKPNPQVSSELRDIIAEDKGTQTMERIIPVINLFDLYAPLPELPASDGSDDWKEALSRIERFLAKKEYSEGEMTNGFNVFLIFLKDLGLNHQNFFLISALVALPENLLTTERDRASYDYYHATILPRYRGLLEDLSRVLIHKDELSLEKINVYTNLKQAIIDYVPQELDGGVNALRKELIDHLAQNGMRFISQDAGKNIVKCLQELESRLISELTSVLEDSNIQQEDIEKFRTKDRIRSHWNELRNIYGNWKRMHSIELVIRTPLLPRQKYSELITFLDLAWQFSLHEILSLPFWNEALVEDEEQKITPLSKLDLQYNELLAKQNRWTNDHLSAAVRATLENMEQKEIELFGGMTSIAQKQKYFSGLGYSDLPDLDNTEKEKIEQFIYPKNWSDTITKQLMERYEKDTVEKIVNVRPPFDPEGVVTGSAVEIMKLQRQIILTMQNRFSERISFYNDHFKRILEMTSREIDKMELSTKTLSQLADLEEIDPDMAHGRARRKIALQLANEMLTFWNSD